MTTPTDRASPDRMKIKRLLIRHYRDNGQTVAYVEYANGSRTEGPIHDCCPCCGQDMPGNGMGSHLAALFARGQREGLPVIRETW